MWHSFRLKLHSTTMKRLPIERVLFSFPETAEYVWSYENNVFNPGWERKVTFYKVKNRICGLLGTFGAAAKGMGFSAHA